MVESIERGIYIPPLHARSTMPPPHPPCEWGTPHHTTTETPGTYHLRQQRRDNTYAAPPHHHAGITNPRRIRRHEYDLVSIALIFTRYSNTLRLIRQNNYFVELPETLPALIINAFLFLYNYNTAFSPFCALFSGYSFILGRGGKPELQIIHE